MTPTYGTTDQFWHDYTALTSDQQRAFRRAARKFAEDLRSGRFRAGLRVKGIQGAGGIFEMTWADDGRATFEYGPPVREGEPHIVWRRIGTHDIFGSP